MSYDSNCCICRKRNGEVVILPSPREALFDALIYHAEHQGKTAEAAGLKTAKGVRVGAVLAGKQKVALETLALMEKKGLIPKAYADRVRQMLEGGA